MGITIKDVAKRADTSITTVSRLMNKSGYVSKEAKKRIDKAIKDLDYKPNVMAQGLINKSLSMKTVGILIPDMQNLFYPAILTGLEDELERHGYSIFLCITNRGQDMEKKYIDTLLGKNVDAIIFAAACARENSADYLVELSEKVPALLINDYIIGSDICSVMADEVGGAYKAATYLLGLGHTKIGFINGNADRTTYRQKQEGYEKALAVNEIKPNNKYLMRETPNEQGGYKGAKKFLALSDPPTAIFAASDQMAIGVIRAVLEVGYSIPEDFSLIGFSNIPLAAEVYPQLTTIDQFPYKTGKLVGEMVMKMINKEDLTQRRILIEPKLLIRKTCRELK